MKKKTILFLYNDECYYLPPFMTILESLCDEYSLKIVNVETENNRKKLAEYYKGKDVEFIGSMRPDNKKDIYSRIRRRIVKIFNIRTSFYYKSIKLVDSTNYDLLWVIHEKTIDQFRSYLKGKKYVTSIYELRDHDPKLLSRISCSVRNAQEVLVAEYNRACISRVWFKLLKTPTVIPNKPLNHPLKREIPNEYSEKLKGKKIVLFQGGIDENRNLDVLCKAVNKSNEWTLVLMGHRTSYRDKLQALYPNVICIDFLAPPHHLDITSYASVGIVKYDYVLLNHAYCAPNKIWEYTGFGIPVLGNDLPGLQYTVGAYGAGEFIDLDNEIEVVKALKRISENYETYKNNAIRFYNSFDVKQKLLEVAERNIQNGND